jgi:hypothetical protein
MIKTYARCAFPLPFLLSYVIVFGTMSLSVASRSRTLLRLKPAETLRLE